MPSNCHEILSPHSKYFIDLDQLFHGKIRSNRGSVRGIDVNEGVV